MKNRVEKIHRNDKRIIYIAVIFLWLVICGILKNVCQSTPELKLKVIIVVIGLIACLLATSSLIAVYIHLKNNKESIYFEELY